MVTEPVGWQHPEEINAARAGVDARWGGAGWGLWVGGHEGRAVPQKEWRKQAKASSVKADPWRLAVLLLLSVFNSS